MKQTWTRSWSAFWNKGSKNSLLGADSRWVIGISSFADRGLWSFYTLFVFRFHCGSDILRYHPYSLPPCHQADLHVRAALTWQIVLVQYMKLWIRFQYQFWPFSRNPVFWSILPKCSSSSWRNVWTTDKAPINPGTYCPFLKAFNNLFLTYKPLTLIFMENNIEHYTLGARIMILTATANTEEENNLLKNALQLLHSTCLPFDRPSSPVLIEWLWQHHFDSLQNQFVELPEVQAFYGIP